MPKPVFWRGGHTFHRLFYHIVFVPKYRRRVLQRQLVQRLTHLFYEYCKANRWYIHELSILPNHVHMLLQLPPKIPLPIAIQYLIRRYFQSGQERVPRS